MPPKRVGARIRLAAVCGLELGCAEILDAQRISTKLVVVSYKIVVVVALLPAGVRSFCRQTDHELSSDSVRCN